MVGLLQTFQQQVRQEQLEALQALAAENQAKSQRFLEENKSKTGIVVMPSGVQYRVIEEGEGPRPSMETTVKVHYRGSKMDGREFDSSFARGVPEEFVVNSVLQGWQEVLPLMKQGSTWQIFVPPELAFGQRGNPPVGPNEALIFDLRLVEIVQ
jgi:FKBP-type peptidyl-prolyl cis-trans isomerase FklB